MWRTVAVGMASTPSLGIDITYGMKDVDSSKQDPFDILTPSGFACHPKFSMLSISM